MVSFKEIQAVELSRIVAGENPGYRIIDVRSPAEVARGSIPGAENIPLHLLPLREADLEPDARLIFYCQSGARSAQACAFLAGKGRQEVYNLRGGIMAWMMTGGAVS